MDEMRKSVCNDSWHSCEPPKTSRTRETDFPEIKCVLCIRSPMIRQNAVNSEFRQNSLV